MELSIMTHNLYLGLKELQPHHAAGLSAASQLRAKIEDYFKWISGMNLDVVGLNELNGWTSLPHDDDDDERDDHGDHDATAGFGSGAQVIANKHGWALAMLKTNRGYDMGIAARISSFPGLLDMRLPHGPATSTDGYHHGLLHVRLPWRQTGDEEEEEEGGTLNVLVTHMSPHSSLKRRDEATRLCAVAQSFQDAAGLQAGHGGGGESGYTVLLGDLNTLSPHDDALRGGGGTITEEVLRTLRSGHRLREKFLVEGLPSSSSSSSSSSSLVVDYQPMDTLLSCFVDLAHAADLAAMGDVERDEEEEKEESRAIGDEQECSSDGACSSSSSSSSLRRGTALVSTVPTDVVEDKMHAAPLRLDFILASPPLLARLTAATDRDSAPSAATTTVQVSVTGSVGVTEATATEAATAQRQAEAEGAAGSAARRPQKKRFEVETLKTERTRGMSDHYPVLARFGGS